MNVEQFKKTVDLTTSELFYLEQSLDLNDPDFELLTNHSKSGLLGVFILTRGKNNTINRSKLQKDYMKVRKKHPSIINEPFNQMEAKLIKSNFIDFTAGGSYLLGTIISSDVAQFVIGKLFKHAINKNVQIKIPTTKDKPKEIKKLPDVSTNSDSISITNLGIIKSDKRQLARSVYHRLKDLQTKGSLIPFTFKYSIPCSLCGANVEESKSGFWSKGESLHVNCHEILEASFENLYYSLITKDSSLIEKLGKHKSGKNVPLSISHPKNHTSILTKIPAYDKSIAIVIKSKEGILPLGVGKITQLEEFELGKLPITTTG